jgi:Zn-finger nucleic acid-binding protein
MRAVGPASPPSLAPPMLLLACPACARQYDATGLEPGREVRCFCEEVFPVAWPRQLPVGALRCTGCGGGVGPDDAACPYCAAALSEEDRRRTTLCPGCFTRLEDDSRHCRACGLAIRPQRLAPLPHDRGCPRCGKALRVRSLAGGDVVECGGCLGLWIEPRHLQRAVAEAAAAGDGGGPAPRPRGPEEVRYLPCLTCGQPMNRRQFRHAGRPSGVVVDHCLDHGVWLDHEELEGLLGFVRATGAGAPMAGLTSPPRAVATVPGAAPPPPERGPGLLEAALALVGELLGGLGGR